MAYIGNSSPSRFVSNRAASVYSGNGSTTDFTLDQAVVQDEDILVSVDGVIQEPSVAYAVSNGTTLAFTAAPSSNAGNNIFVYYLASQVGTAGPPNDSVSTTTLKNSAVTSAKIADGTIVNADINASAGIAGSKLGTDAVLQVRHFQTGAVDNTTTTIPNDDTIPQNNEGGEFMTLSITPKSASNKLLIQVVMCGGANDGARQITSALFQDSTANALATVGHYQVQSTGMVTVTFNHYMTAGTTSATTFKVRGGASIGNYTLNGYNNTTRTMGGVTASSITITEIGG